MIQNLIYITACLLVLTKLADVITTLLRIQHHHNESNIIARTVMARLGIVPTIWIIFIISVLIIVLSLLLVLQSEIFIQYGFIFVGCMIALIQGAVAHANWFQRDNIIVRFIRTTLQRIYF